MARPKKQKLKQRADGRFRCKYKGIPFYSYISSDDAIAQREEYKRQEAAGEFKRANPTVRDYADAWLPSARAKIRATSMRANKTHLQHLCDVIGDLYMREVRPSDVRRVYSEKYLGASNGYIRHAKSLFSAMFSAAVDDGIIRTNPVKAESAQPHKGTEGHYRAITPEERKLIETVALDLPASAVARIMLYSGLRPQEIKALRVEDIDQAAGVICVRRFIHKDRANSYAEDEIGKNKKAARDVPLFPPVLEAVKGKTGYIISNHGELVTPSVWDNEWRTYKNAIERHLNGMQRRWYGKTREHKALLAAGKPLPEWKTFDVVPYDLRHSFVTWCRDNGVELHTCIEWMGHADATMIMQIYDDPAARSKIEAEKLIKKCFKGSAEGSKAKTSAESAAPTSASNDTSTAS